LYTSPSGGIVEDAESEEGNAVLVIALAVLVVVGALLAAVAAAALVTAALLVTQSRAEVTSVG
jgi:hypothetical protein